MSEDRLAFIKQCLADGKTDLVTIKSELISNGYTTEGFESQVAQAQIDGAPASEVATEAPVSAATTTPADTAAAEPIAPMVEAASAATPTATAEAESATAPEIMGAWAFATGALKYSWHRLDLVGWSILMQAAAVLPFLALVGGFAVIGESAALAIGVLVGVAVLIGISILNAGSLLYATAQAERTSYWTGWNWAWQNVWAFAWIGLLMGAVSLTGYLFFIIPGIALAIYLIFSQYAFIFEGKRGIAALIRSTQAVKGRWWKTLRCLLALMLIMFAVAFGLGIILAIAGVAGSDTTADVVSEGVQFLLQSYITVGMFAMFAALYRQYIADRPLVEDEGSSKLSFWYKVMAWFSLVALVAVVVLVGVLSSYVMNAQDGAQDAVTKSIVSNARVWAELHAVESGSYEDYCLSTSYQSAVEGQAIDCMSTDAAYRVSAELGTGEWYCIDNTGASLTVATEPLGTQCGS